MLPKLVTVFVHNGGPSHTVAQAVHPPLPIHATAPLHSWQAAVAVGHAVAAVAHHLGAIVHYLVLDQQAVHKVELVRAPLYALHAAHCARNFVVVEA
jgi:hypothetical protein